MQKELPPIHPGPTPACGPCLEMIEADQKQVRAGIRMIKKLTKEIRKYPTDTRGVVEYNTGRIIEIADELL